MLDNENSRTVGDTNKPNSYKTVAYMDVPEVKHYTISRKDFILKYLKSDCFLSLLITIKQ